MRSSKTTLTALLAALCAQAWSGCSGSDDTAKGGSQFSNGGSAATTSGGASGNSTGGSGGTAASGFGGSAAAGGTFNFDSAGGSAGSAGLQDGQVCNATEQTGQLVPANLLFVLDKSGSMNCFPGEDESTCNLQPKAGSKWLLTLDGFGKAIDALAASSNVSAGLAVFPVASYNCEPPMNPFGSPAATPPLAARPDPDVAVAKLDAFQATALKLFLGAVNPGGATPIAGSTIWGFNYLHTRLQSSGNKFLVLLTDGFETCKPEELPNLLNKAVPDAAKVGIRTFVIGVPGSENARSLLSQMAFIGGTARTPTCTHTPVPNGVGDCHFDMTQTQDFSTDLANALAAISGTVLTCEFNIPAPGPGVEFDPDQVNVLLNGGDVFPEAAPTPQDDVCVPGKSGWQYNASKTKILLCGQKCDDAKQPNASVKIAFGCPTHPPA